MRRARAKVLEINDCTDCPFAHMTLNDTDTLDGTICTLVDMYIFDIGPLPNCPLRKRGFRSGCTTKTSRKAFRACQPPVKIDMTCHANPAQLKILRTISNGTPLTALGQDIEACRTNGWLYWAAGNRLTLTGCGRRAIERGLHGAFLIGH